MMGRRHELPKKGLLQSGGLMRLSSPSRLLWGAASRRPF